jgi:hypothetical protein
MLHKIYGAKRWGIVTMTKVASNPNIDDELIAKVLDDSRRINRVVRVVRALFANKGISEDTKAMIEITTSLDRCKITARGRRKQI